MDFSVSSFLVIDVIRDISASVDRVWGCFQGFSVRSNAALNSFGCVADISVGWTRSAYYFLC